MDPLTLPTTPPPGLWPGAEVWAPALVVLAPEGREAVYLLDTGVFLVGRDPAADLHLQDATVSWAHARFVVAKGADARSPAVDLEDRGSTNGTWVNGEPVRGRRRLHDRDVVRIGSFSFAFAVLDELQLGAAVRLVQWASYDALTGAHNRRAFEREVRLRMAEASRCGWPLSLIVLDVDHFKRVNDTYGHAFGDAVLQRLVARIEASVRHGDLVGRVGGEEFAAVLAAAPLDEALEVAERVRFGVAADTSIAPGLTVTVSVGVASLPVGLEIPAEVVIGAADKDMYRAKAEGRNCVRGGTIVLLEPG